MRAAFPVLLLGLCTLVPTTTIYRLALKDGSVVQFQKCRLAGTALFYVDADGKETSVSLAIVDLNRTRELNSSATPPLDLSKWSTDAQVSLGEVARRLRRGESTAAGKRIYTNDDLPATPSRARAGGPGRSEEPREWNPNRIRALLVEWQALTPEQLARAALRDLSKVDFPTRFEWLRRLQAQLGHVKEAMDGYLWKGEEYAKLRDILRLAKTRTAADGDRLEKARLAELEAGDEARRQFYRYLELENEGRQRAAEWKAK